MIKVMNLRDDNETMNLTHSMILREINADFNKVYYKFRMEEPWTPADHKARLGAVLLGICAGNYTYPYAINFRAGLFI